MAAVPSRQLHDSHNHGQQDNDTDCQPVPDYVVPRTAEIGGRKSGILSDRDLNCLRLDSAAICADMLALTKVAIKKSVPFFEGAQVTIRPWGIAAIEVSIVGLRPEALIQNPFPCSTAL